MLAHRLPPRPCEALRDATLATALGPGRTPRLPRMEAFFVVVVAVTVLGVGLVALVALRRMRRNMNPTDNQER